MIGSATFTCDATLNIEFWNLMKLKINVPRHYYLLFYYLKLIYRHFACYVSVQHLYMMQLRLNLGVRYEVLNKCTKALLRPFLLGEAHL